MDLSKMILEEAQVEISNSVYQACALFERLECVRKVRGNGHHIRQQVAEFAKNLMTERWQDGY